MTLTYQQQQQQSNQTQNNDERPLVFSVTGSAAHGRLCPLVPSHWIDASPYAAAQTTTTTKTDNVAATSSSDQQSSSPVQDSQQQQQEGHAPDFLWENAPRHETRAFRDSVQCYSHLPNGTDILDSKWVLARLLGGKAEHMKKKSPHLATLEAHCFRGRQGFVEFGAQVGLTREAEDVDNDDDVASSLQSSLAFNNHIPDLDAEYNKGKDFTFPQSAGKEETKTPNWWVVKDASSNGAGGIWVVGPSNAQAFGSAATSPLLRDHKYVAQKYAWPCVLFRGRKTHIRVYGLMTSDGRAWIHQRCFLHVANDQFAMSKTTTSNDKNNTSAKEKKNYFEDSVHITNCCANSHDKDKFAGEICARLFESSSDPEHTDDTTTENTTYENVTENNQDDQVDLSQFFPSIQASMATLAERTFPFLQGGTANNGFEYLGLDFILSYDAQGRPLAYLLEVNAPPSQDTATGLPHAEDLHDSVLRDLVTLWVLPKVTQAVTPSVHGGWRMVYSHSDNKHISVIGSDKAIPSKATTLNRMRWAIFEQKAAKRDQEATRQIRSTINSSSTINIATIAREHFDYYAGHLQQPVFMENAGGTQVPRQVIRRMTASLQCRHRNVVGARLKTEARLAMASLLGANTELYDVCLGMNATAMFSKLAELYIRRQMLTSEDEIVLSIENHWANVDPWVNAAEQTGAKIVWWDMKEDDSSLKHVLSASTRIVALSHASNVLGQVRNLCQQAEVIRARSPRAEIVVDGVAAAPHLSPRVAESDADYYVVSCHKLFGPHLGVLCGRRDRLQRFLDLDSAVGTESLFETGTTNYEACAGVQGMLDYFRELCLQGKGTRTEKEPTTSLVERAYTAIGAYEACLTQTLMEGLTRSPNVQILSVASEKVKRLPIVSFVHTKISGDTLVKECAKHGFACRHGTFLASQAFLDQLSRFSQGFVRFSLVHYNTVDEVKRLLQFLETLPDWN